MLLLGALLAHAGDLPVDATGRFVATQSAAEAETLIAEALTRTTDAIPWGFRTYARSMLEAQTLACPAYTITLTTTTFDVQCDGRRKYSMTLGESGPFV